MSVRQSVESVPKRKTGYLKFGWSGYHWTFLSDEIVCKRFVLEIGVSLSGISGCIKIII